MDRQLVDGNVVLGVGRTAFDSSHGECENEDSSQEGSGGLNEIESGLRRQEVRRLRKR